MRIVFSEPECSTCFHYHSIVNTHQEPEPSNVIASLVNSIPVTSEPVQALGHDDSAAIGSIPASSSPPIHGSSSPIRTGTPITNQNQNRNTTSVSTTSSSPPTQALNQTDFGFSAFAGPKPSQTGSIQAPVQTSTSSSFGTVQDFGKTTLSASASEFGNGVAFARTDIGYAPNQTDFGFSAFAGPKPHRTSSIQAPVQASPSFSFGTAQASPSPSPSLFDFARSDVGYAPTGVVFGSPPLSVSSVCASTTPKDPFSSYFPGFGVGYLPGSSSNLFVSTASSANGSIPESGTTTTLFPSSSSRCPGYASTPDVVDASKHLVSISASNAYGKKSHEELRWEDYKQGDKGGSLFPAAHVSSLGSRRNAASPSSMFASRCIPEHPQSTNMSNIEKLVVKLMALVKTCPSSVYGQTNGFPNGVTTTLFPSSSSSSAISSCTPNIGSSSQGSKYPSYKPTLDGRDMIESISASNAYQNISHEELRWEDYKQGDKGGLFPSAHISRPNTASPSIFASQSIPNHPQRTTGGKKTASASSSFPAGVTSSSSSVLGQANAPFTGLDTTAFRSSSSSSLSSSTTFPAAASSTFQRPRETVVGSSPASSSGCCTACGASSAFSNLTFNGAAITPPSAATPLPRFSFSTSGSCPVMFGTTPAVQAHPTLFGTNLAPQAYPTMFGTNPAAQGATPAVQAHPTLFGTNLVPQAYPTMFGTNPAAQSAIPAVQAHPTLFGTNLAPQAYPTMFGTNLAAHGTTPAVQVYPTMFGPNIAARGTNPTVQAYPTMFNTNLGAQGTNPAPQAYPTMFNTNLGAQGTTPAVQAYSTMFGTNPAVQAYPTMFGTNVAAQGRTPTVQAYPTMFGTNLGAQGRTPTVQAYPTMFGTNFGAQGTNLGAQGTIPAVQAYPTMFGTNLAAQGTNLAVQGTAPAFQAYPMMIGSNLGYILLPFAAMNLQ